MDLKLKNNSQLTLPIVNRVEYIETSGAPNINTGVTFYMYNLSTNKSKIECTIEIIVEENASGHIYIANGSSKSTHLQYSNGTIYAASAKSNTSGGTEVEIIGKSTLVHTISNISINGTITNITGQNSGTARPTIYLLSDTENIKVRIWNYKVYNDSNTLVRNYIPVISIETGHIGEAALYDLVNNKYYYPASTGTFTASHPQGLYNIITSSYIKDCPNISGINILRSCINLNRVRLDIGTQSGTVAELYKYAAYAGFNDAYENQTKPRLVGTWTISDYWTSDELSYLQSAFDGLTISYDSNKNVDTLLENDDFAIQTLDSSKSGYNPAVAIIMQNNDLGITSVLPLNDGGRFGFLKNDSTTTLPAIFRDKTTVVDSNKIVSDDDTASYSFTSFNEFEDMTNITTIADYAFRGDTNLIEIKLPNTITTIGNGVFRGCTSLKDLYIPCNSGPHVLVNNENVSDYCGDGTGTLFVNGDFSASLSWGSFISFKYVLVKGNCSTGNGRLLRFKTRATTFRINGNLAFSTGSNTNMFNGGPLPEFFEVIGSISATKLLFNAYMTLTISVFHAAHNQVMSVTPSNLKIGSVSKIYVGDGSSKAADQAVFDLYNADSNWSAYCGSGVPGAGKVDLWWNYNGEYKWYYITDNLTNCTNTNPDAWPHITRGEEYRTTIVADEGYTLDTVKVEMYSARDNSLTPDEPTDITSAVYDANTGEIYIQEVVGNVIITANAN